MAGESSRMERVDSVSAGRRCLGQVGEPFEFILACKLPDCPARDRRSRHFVKAIASRDKVTINQESAAITRHHRARPVLDGLRMHSKADVSSSFEEGIRQIGNQ